VALLSGGAGGTVAVADPDSSGSAAHGDDGINASGHQHSTGAKKPKDEPGATTSGTGAATSGTGATVTNLVAAVPGLAASVTNAFAPAPNLVSDVNALIQDMLPSGAGAVVPVTQLQSELAFFLFGITGVEPVVDAGGRIDSAALSASVQAWVASELPRLRAFAGIPGMPAADIAIGVAPLGGLRRPFSPR